jgi:hypothetical protein
MRIFGTSSDWARLLNSYSYFIQMLGIFSSPPFYTNYVQLPSANKPIEPYIKDNAKFFPFFEDAVGAIDGTHFTCSPTAAERAAARDYKGGMTQNCLAACNFNLEFIYIFSGWEGSATDSAMFNNARLTDLHILPGKFYLADAGFPSSLGTVIPYRGKCYHLTEWGRAGLHSVIPLSVLFHS